MQFDPRLNDLGINVVPTPNAKWALTIARYQNDQESSGNHHVYFTVLDANGKPTAGVTCVVDWVGREPNDPPTKVITDANGQCNVPLFANLDTTLKNGPYFAFVEDQTKSDMIRGLGLPEKHHVNFLLTFAPAPATPSPASTLENAAIAAAQKLTWMPINTESALYKFAMSKNLGYPQTDEFEFTFNNETYIGQVYNLGIVFVKKGDWGNCKWVKKP